EGQHRGAAGRLDALLGAAEAVQVGDDPGTARREGERAGLAGDRAPIELELGRTDRGRVVDVDEQAAGPDHPVTDVAAGGDLVRADGRERDVRASRPVDRREA